MVFNRFDVSFCRYDPVVSACAGCATLDTHRKLAGTRVYTAKSFTCKSVHTLLELTFTAVVCKLVI